MQFFLTLFLWPVGYSHVTSMNVSVTPTRPVGIVLLEVLYKGWGFFLPALAEFIQPLLKYCHICFTLQERKGLVEVKPVLLRNPF